MTLPAPPSWTSSLWPAASICIISLLEMFGLPTTTDFSSEALLSHALSDKKRSADTVNLIVPSAIGHCAIMPTHVEKLKTFIEEGM